MCAHVSVYTCLCVCLCVSLYESVCVGGREENGNAEKILNSVNFLFEKLSNFLQNLLINLLGNCNILLSLNVL